MTHRVLLGTVFADPVDVDLPGLFSHVCLTLTERTSTGSVALSLRAPGNTEFTVPENNVLTLGSNAAIAVSGMLFDRVRLTPSLALSQEVQYQLSVWLI